MSSRLYSADSDDNWPHFDEVSLFEEVTVEAARELGIAREMAMMCAFGAMATACQGLIDVQMPTGKRIPASLMLLTIAESGERKTTAQNHFFRAISALNDDAYKNNLAHLKEHRVEHELWNAQKRHLFSKYKKYADREDETSTHEALEEYAEHVRREPLPDPSGKFLFEDTTPQALVQMLYENSANACLLTSEANSIFHGKALGELDKLNTLWDGGSVIVDRISRDSFVLQDARLTLSLMAQPSVLNSFMDKRGEEARGTGFLARLLVAKPRTMAGRRNDQKLSDLPRQQAFNERIRTLLTGENLGKRQTLRFSEEATDQWYKLARELEEQMQENGLFHYAKDHASKLLENTTRLAAVLNAFEFGIDAEIRISSLNFCWDFAYKCSSHFMKHLANEPQVVSDANLIAHFLLSKSNKENRSLLTPTLPPNFTSHPSFTSPPRYYPSTPKRPSYLLPGVRTNFTLTDIKQKGPGRLRGRSNAQRLAAAIELLIKLGHVEKMRSSGYKFQETILLKCPPAIRNGESITINELPLFHEQEYWNPTHISRFAVDGYYLLDKNHTEIKKYNDIPKDELWI